MRKVQISVHPKMGYMATIGSDKYLCIWDIYNNIIYERLEMNITPTSIKWNPDGTLLIVGHSNGSLSIY